MDSNKTSATEAMSHLSGSSSSLSYANYDNHNSIKNIELEVESNSKTSSGDGGRSSDSESDDGGYLSGEEEFETASEKPIVPDNTGEEATDRTAEEDDTDASFMDSSEFSMPNSVLPIQKVSADDNDEDEDAGDSKVRDLTEEESVGGDREKGFEFKTEKPKAVEDQKGKIFDVEQSVETKEQSGAVEVEAEGVKFTGGGGSIVDALKSGAAVVGYLEGIMDAEVKGLEVPAERNVSLENGFDQINHDDEQVVESTLVPVGSESQKNFESPTCCEVETKEVKPSEQKVDAAIVCKDENLVGNKGIVNDKEKAASISEPKPDFEAKQTLLNMNGVSDVVEYGSSVNVDEGIGYKTRAVGLRDEPMQTDAVHEYEHLQNNQILVTAHPENLEDEESGKSHPPESVEVSGTSNVEVTLEEDEKRHADEEFENEGSASDGETDGMRFGSSGAAKQFLEELEQAAGVGSQSESSRDHSQRIDGQIATDSDEEVDTDDEGEGKELFDSAALAALLKSATGADSDGGGSSITITSQGGSKLFSVERPAGLGTSLRTLKPAPPSNRTNLFTPSNLTTRGETETNLSEEEKRKLEKLQQLRVKFLRLVHRLGHSPEDSMAAQVLYRLSLVAGRQTGQLFNLDAAKRTALQLEEGGEDDLNFSLNILVLGKTAVGKSATINSILGEEKTLVHTFEPGTISVKEIVGTVDGVKIRVIDTPGLKSSGREQGANRKVLSSIKKFTKKCPPDIVLYVDRLDSQTRDLNDLPLLRSISDALGASIWRSAIVTLTHAASAPPDGPSGSPLSYEGFVTQRSHVVQQSIGQAVGDLRLMNPSLMNPVSLVENHPACRKNKDGQKVLPNGQTWRPQLLLLCYSMKILSEASSLSKPQDPFDHRKLFGFRARSPPLPYLLSWLLQSRTHPKLSTDQGGDNGDSDIDLADLSDSDQEEDEDEYDQLPPFKPLRKAQIAKLSKEQKKAYFEEYDYRVKLLQKKQWREELRRSREMKKKGRAASEDYGYIGEDVDQENGSPAAVPVPLPDMVLPPSFDGDNPAYRYRFLEPTSLFVARPVLDTHGWDHDCGYDGVNLEHSLAIASRFPAAVTVQVTKDKKEFNLHLDSSIAAKLGENRSSMAGFDIQNVGKQLAYILRGEMKFKNFRRNKTAAGISVTFLGENVATGLKLEDQIALGKRLMLVGSSGIVRSQGDSAYGANLEVRLREADFPIGQDQSSLGLSLVKWRGDLALGANLQSQFSVGRSSKLAIHAGLNNKLSGQITVRSSTSDQLQIALLGILTIAIPIYKSIRPGASDNYSVY